MDTSKLKKFAQYARRYLMDQVAAKLKFVLTADGPARRENAKAVEELESQIRETSRERVIEKIAYIWFNRFCAIRFMDVNRYTRIGILSPAEGQLQPEILAEAKMGHIDEEIVPNTARQKVFNLLNGSAPSRDPQAEAYHILIVAACNYYNRTMPFMFERIADYTELLIPDDLLSGNSILAYIREAMTPDACRDVEVIGWLYQFYVSEKKDEVFEGLKKNKKIAPENIPAATQLFTPHWIVRYLVENSLGRLWMLNRPNSRLIEQMDYYIKPESPETDFLRINGPEELKLCDPAAGSGHMLTYSYDLLYAIYEEEGYDANNIPRLILENNLFGIEIDERAGELAAFALTMKAAKGNPRDEKSNHRRFFRNPVQPNICVLQNVHFDDDELKNYMDAIGRDLFTINLQTMLHQFREAVNFGSLIRPEYVDAATILRIVEQKRLTSDLFLQKTHEKVLLALKQADYLSPKYHVVIANPPYMGGKGMNLRLSAWAKDNYPDSKADLFSMFIERILAMISPRGYAGLMTPFTWMFLTSFENLRSVILNTRAITGLVRPEYHSFFESAYVPICGFTIYNRKAPTLAGSFVDLNQFYGADNQPMKLLEAINNHDCGWFHMASSEDFLKIPGNPIAYWISEKARDLFEECLPVGEIAHAKQGLITGDNDRFLRLWSEIEFLNIGLGFASRDEANESKKKWFPHHKGGAFRKWYGNHEYVVDWKNDGENIKNFVDENGKLRSRPQNLDFYFKPAVTWTSLTVASFNGRLCHGGFVYDAKGPMVSPIDQKYRFALAGLLNCSVTNYLLKVLAPTMDYNQGPVSKLPWPNNIELQTSSINDTVKLLEATAKSDWDSYETSWNFTSLPLLYPDYCQPTLKATYQKIRAHWRDMTHEMQRLEEENNRIFIDAYGLQDELAPEVPLNEITLTCNPHCRYGNNKSEEELEALLLSDTMKEFISYAAGCMFGRYSLDTPGLVLANQGETVEDYDKKVYGNDDGQPQLLADPDSVLLRPDSNVSCFSCGAVMNPQEALFILADLYGTDYVSGRPMVYCRRCYEERKDKIGLVKPLPEFSLHEGLRNKWTGHGTFSQFLEMTGCFDYRMRPANEIAAFRPDDNNVISILDEGWFIDDITERFRKFLKVTFGEEHYEENLAFIEGAIGKDIRKYFLKDFYNDHVKRYKKRPIYWLFSSPKGTFNAMIYMHRYRPDTVSVILNDYLREFRTKLSARKDHLEQVSISASASAREKTQALKDLEKLRKMIEELDEYERDTLYPLATKQLSIDLDDGVKVNYLKFGNALKKIPGLEAGEE